MSKYYNRVLITDFFDERNSMEYWLPKARETNAKIPTTKIFNIPNNDPEKIDVERIINFAEENNLERLFIRSMYKSAVLSLQEGSIVWNIDKENILSTVRQLVKQHQNNMARVPTGEKIAVREYIDCSYCPYYHDKSVKHTHTTEVRFFVKDGSVLYCHPTVEELVESNLSKECTYSTVEEMLDNVKSKKVKNKAQKVAEKFKEESWSVDFLLSSRGNWYLTDMGLNGLYYNKQKERWNNISGHKDNSKYNLMKTVDTESIPEEYKKKFTRFS